MSEFGMRHTAAAGGGHTPAGGGDVGWVSTTSTSANYGGGYASYGAGNSAAYSGASTSGYGTTDAFEDEPPLLEGERGVCHTA